MHRELETSHQSELNTKLPNYWGIVGGTPSLKQSIIAIALIKCFSCNPQKLNKESAIPLAKWQLTIYSILFYQ
jgi:hypothetical protein